MKKKIVLIALFFAHACFANDQSLSQKQAATKKVESYFTASVADIQKILSNKVFEKYSDYTIESIRQGELGESQAYFIRLIKPFDSKPGICFDFIGTDHVELISDCDAVH